MEIGPAIVSVFLIALSVGQTPVYGNYVPCLGRLDDEVKTVASQSSTWSDGGKSAPAYLAIDGNPDRDFFNSYSCSHTGEDANPFWMLKLGKTARMSRVHIYNREDSGAGARFTDIEIKVYKYTEDVLEDRQGTVVATYDKQTPVEHFIKIKFNAPIYGMWLKIGFKTKNKAGRIINFCEVEVYNCDD